MYSKPVFSFKSFNFILFFKRYFTFKLKKMIKEQTMIILNGSRTSDKGSIIFEKNVKKRFLDFCSGFLQKWSKNGRKNIKKWSPGRPRPFFDIFFFCFSIFLCFFSEGFYTTSTLKLAQRTERNQKSRYSFKINAFLFLNLILKF